MKSRAFVCQELRLRWVISSAPPGDTWGDMVGSDGGRAGLVAPG